MPTKIWAVGEEVLAADFNDMVQEQVVATFPNAAARSAAIAAPTAGMVTYLADVNALQVYNGTAWVGLPGATTAPYAYLTAPSGAVASTPLAVPGLGVNVIAVGARRIKLTAHCLISQTGGPSLVRLTIVEGATTLATAFESIIVNGWVTTTSSAVVNAAAGSHTYQVYLATDVGTALVHGASVGPSWLLAEDIG